MIFAIASSHFSSHPATSHTHTRARTHVHTHVSVFQYSMCCTISKIHIAIPPSLPIRHCKSVGRGPLQRAALIVARRTPHRGAANGGRANRGSVARASGHAAAASAIAATAAAESAAATTAATAAESDARRAGSFPRQSIRHFCCRHPLESSRQRH
jgi:hypothetical protein